ncbi:uncharacterized protein UV8b_05116 [Ustilaginoidea virens]|uniref:Uncharacterized protein n=1 Tax=Ustilaginoidea virens TaxID=1159556 RepID=A0A063BWU0_USTVR|nr:uncharacterized protein UV8b_05116 [Ustilaginoidea virens]QUC20875.1 hypothetical protein UV8b_05116 [Ustilaginoidea virens]GAO14947.1 hypothetical protein UVI_02007830 [Ustilaginoidea virens]
METYHGHVRTPSDAIKLFEACRLGLLPRVQRRLSEKERQSIRSGSVFVWDEREAGMRRWTDGKSWSASRVSGSFLTYREMEGKRGGGFGNGRRGSGKTPDSGRGSDEDHDDGEPEGYRYKADGLMKQSFSITTSTGQHLHLISYYSRPQPGQPELPQPSSDPTLRAIVPPKGMYPESSMGDSNQTPALTRAPMQQPYLIAHHAHGHAHAHGHHHQQQQQQQQQAAFMHYSQTGYGWPPSPAATPPYAPYNPAPYPPGHAAALPPPHVAHHHGPHHSAYSHGHYTHSPSSQPPSYDRPSLPPLQHSKPGSLPPPNQPGLSPPRLSDPPGYKERPAAHGPLPALNSVAAPPIPHQALTPPTREHSVSPPKAAHDKAVVNVGRSSLCALLHPTSSSPKIKQESTASGNGSPKANGILLDKCGVSEDARALRMLDRKFCL